MEASCAIWADGGCLLTRGVSHRSLIREGASYREATWKKP